jgi:predicted transcriptional regulator
MSKLNDLLQELGVSKVRLAKYLGVSRQMVYNYLELNDINKWPKEKKILLFKLLDVQDGDDETISSINVTTEYLMEVENRLNQGVKSASDLDSYFDLKGLSKEEQNLLMDITYLLKERMLDEKNKKENVASTTYLYHLLQSIDNVPEINYFFGYISKITGFIKHDEYKFDEDKQFIFEGILYSALNLYNTGGASRSRVAETHEKFVQEIERRNEEKQSRTQQLNTYKVQALRELGYDKITADNYEEFIEKLAEIESRYL